MTPIDSSPAVSAAGRNKCAVHPRLLIGLACSLALTPAYAADVTYDFTSDPTSVLVTGGNGVNTAPWQASGGNPGGFLGLTYSVNGLYQGVIFPNADPGKIVTGFTFSADLRVGNSVGDRAADGFSVSFARDGDPVLAEGGINGMGPFAGGIAEGGTTTGIAVCFDTWSGNTLPDGGDIEGIIVRVDNKTVNRTGLPTRHGACDDNTSLQTGPRDADYWANGGDAYLPEAWAGLCWQPFKIEVTTDAKLTVEWKGRKILDGFQTDYFPTAGQIVLAGRTGDANEATHFDNLHLVTTAEAVTTTPNAPTGLVAALTGSRRVELTWTAATVDGDPNARLAYEVERNGTVISGLLTTTTFVDRGVTPGQSVSYKVRAKNIAGNAGPDATLSVTTAQEVAGTGFLRQDVWDNTSANTILDLFNDPHLSEAPDRSRFVNGLGFSDFADNYVAQITGVFTAPKTGNFRFFVRSDDASALFLNQTGTTIPNWLAENPIASEGYETATCCGNFEEPLQADGATPNPETSEPIALVAGKQYGIAFLVKEGGGGDNGYVAIREEGDTTPAANLPILRGSMLSGLVDAVGASIALDTVPGNTTATANTSLTLTAAASGSSPYGDDYGNTIVYQWFKNGVPIIGANGPTYTIPVLPIADNGAKFKVWAAVAGASVTSDEFTLTVETDTIAPTVTRVSGSASFDSVTVTFSEPVTDATALDASKYTVAGLTLSAPVRVNDRTIRLTTTTQTEGTTYNITVNGVKDIGGNDSAYTGTFRAYQFKTGLATYKTWNSTIAFDQFDAELRDSAPVSEEVVTEFHSPINIRNDFFGQVSGWFVPETTGSYVFYVATDDQGALYLSTDASPVNKKLIATEPTWGGANSWTGAGNNRDPNGDGLFLNRSDTFPATEWPTGNTITLTAGNRYYMEVVYREGGGGDNGGATFKLAGTADPANGSSTVINGARIGTLVDPGTLPPIITQAPTTKIVAPGESVTFTVEVDSAIPVTYQWYRNNKAIEGATSASYTVPSAGITSIGDYRVTVTNGNGSASNNDNNARLLLKDAFVVEAEDFNFDNGQTLAAASVMPLASSLYQGKDGQPGVDLSVIESTADGSANGNSLRQGWVDGDGLAINAPETANADVISDGNAERPDFTLTQNYKVGWGDTGEWYNYTRDFPAGTYSAVLGFSHDGRAANSESFALDIVTGDITKADTQTLTRIAAVTADQTGGWSSNDNIPFVNADGTATTFTLGANTTIRLTITAGSPDLDYLLFYKTSTVVPTVTASASDVPGLSGAGISNVSVNAATKTITATTSGEAGFVKVTGATRIVSVTLVGTTLTVVYE